MRVQGRRGAEYVVTHADRFQKRAFSGPYPEPHTTRDGRKLPPDGTAQPETVFDQSGVGLSYPDGRDFGPYVQRLGECPRMWNHDAQGVPFSAGNVHPHTGLMLYALALNARPTVIVETGTFFGYSTWFLAQAMREWGEGTVYTIDPDFQHVADCVRNHPHVRLVPGNSIDMLPRLLSDLEGEVHFAFLDAYKRQALAEFQLLDRAMVPGGIVVFHDTQAFNTGRGLWALLQTHPHYESMLFSGTPAVDNPHRFFGNADDRGLGVLRKKERDPFLDVADHGTHSETFASTGEKIGSVLFGITENRNAP